MAHTRLRKFNTRDTYPEQKLDNDLCQTVVARGTMVFVRGQIGQDLDTRESVAIGDAAGQTERAMSNIKMLLKKRARSSSTSARSRSTLSIRATANRSTGQSANG
jgi:enamine deaminase RidA (YjgF/YER057c/UK114 family)